MSGTQNLGRLFAETARKFPKKAAFLYKLNGRYEPLLWEEVSRQIRSVASFFLRLGLKTGDRIAILSENRPEWAMTDLAAQMIGLMTVPVYPSLTPAEVRYLLADSEATLIAVSDTAQFQKILAIAGELPGLKTLLAFDSSVSASEGEISQRPHLWREAAQTPVRPDLDELCSRVSPEAVASIIYTSGTTGVPKGAQLTHSNFIHNVVACRDTLKMDENDLHLSFLPLCHVFERTAGYYLMVYIGATIAYAENLDRVPVNVLEIRPTFLLGVPRFYEKVHGKVLASMKTASPLRRRLFEWARQAGKKRRLAQGRSGWKEGLSRMAAEALVYRKFRARLGGRIRFCVSGSAPISREILEFFHDLGVKIYEGYGLTETSPVISVNREDRWRIGTVGVPLDGVEVKIASDGEILTRSACVMKGYYRKPAETEAVLKDGWFYTGDLGRLDTDGFLSITGRKKELIVTSGGKKICPQPIEELLARDPYILRCVLFGEGRKFLTALVVPRREELLSHAAQEKMAYASYESLLQDPMIYAFFETRIHELMADFASYEKIKYFALLPCDFSQEAGELTPTLKVRREAVLSRYQDRLLPFYSDAYPAAE